MPRTALLGYVVFAATALGWRTYSHWRRTGSTGYRGLSGRPGSLEWWGGALFFVANLATPVAALLQLTGVAQPLVEIPPAAALLAGGTLFAIGLLGTIWSQGSMGDSWRVGVDASERTSLVTRGPYQAIRNPIFTFMITGLIGVALLTPNVVALLAIVALVTAVEIQVKAVEEPYLEHAHGDDYRAYRARTWRFVPGFGR